VVSEGAKHRDSIPLLLALTCAGLAGNYFRYPVFFNIDFTFGSIFALLALQFLGTRRGLLATLVISSFTLILWNHPYAMVIACAETAVVGWLMTRRRMGMVLADTLFWLCLGMPLIYFCYNEALHASPSSVNLTMVKQTLNGIANALVARLVFTGHSLSSRSLTISFREMLYNLLALFVLLPALILLALWSRSDFAETDGAIRAALSRDSRRVTRDLEHWLNARKAVTGNLAQLAATLPPQEMQARLEQARASDLHLLRIGLHDRDAVTVAHAPLTDESGQSNLGLSFANRPFIARLQRTLKPMLSEMVQGTIDPARPRVLMLSPVVVDGAYAGYIAGVLNLDRMQTVIEENADSQHMLYTLLDNNGKIILTNHRDQQAMKPLARGAGELKQLGDGISQWQPVLPSGTPGAERWQQSLYLKKTPVGTFAEWDLVLEQPVAPFQQELYDSYSHKLWLLFLILLGALAVAELLSRRIHGCIENLRGITSDLPARVAQGQAVSWPESPVLELRELLGNFMEVTNSLAERFSEISRLNESLEQRVGVGTLELESLNRDFLSFLENTSDFIYFKNEHSRFRFCSQPLAVITGHASWRDMIGKHDLEVFPEDTARLYLEEELAIFRDGTSLLNRTDPYYDAQGNLGWVSTNKWPVFDAAGKVVGIFGISRDITELMQIQESLRLARQSMDQVPDAIMWTDTEGRIVDCNEGACLALGYSHQQLLESTIFAIDSLTSAGNWPDTFAQLRQQRVKHFESVYRTRDGRSIPMDVQVAHISFGAAEFLCGVARDISERKEMEDRLRSSEASLNRAQAMAKLGSWEWDPASDQVSYSEGILDILGIDRMQFGADLVFLMQDCIHPEDRERVVQARERARRSGVAETVEYRITRPDGALRWIRAIGEFVREPGRPPRVIGALQDITEGKLMEEERLRLERQMLHVQKLESLGVLSGGIAHDFNNLLQVVLGNLDLSLMLMPEGVSVRKNLEQAVIATVRASELSGMMLAYSGKGVLAIKELDLSLLVQENLAMLGTVISRPVSFSSSLAPALPPVQADAAQLLQVVVSLVRNASEAIADGNGAVTVSTGVQFFDAGALAASRLEEKLPPGRYVWMQVSDTGCGMDDATQYKVFDPFFTTKFTGRGLGMSAALGIMRAHRGAIMLESSPGSGTTVRLLFPVPDPRQAAPEPPRAVQPPPAAVGELGETVLVVDDEEMIRTLSVAMLEAFGYDTLVAADGEKALEIFRREAGRISLVLLDQSMPIMDGLAVFKEMRRFRPEVKVLLATGFSEEEVAARYQGLGLDGFIRKPFNVNHLYDEIQRVLLGAPPGGLPPAPPP
jgi:two-component system, cell cycle sensor histidine kinase and response regulator CckA